MLKWTDADKVDYKKLNTYVLKKKNTARKGEYSFKLITIPMGGVDMPISKHDDTLISDRIKTFESAINVEDVQDWNNNNDLKSSLKFGDHCLLRYPRFEMEKRLDPKRCEENPWHYEVQMYLGGNKFDGVDHDLSSDLDIDTIEWAKLD
jgi:hypothetical protein